MRTFGSEKNYGVWDEKITQTLMMERTTGTTFPINPDDVMPRYLKAKTDQKSRTQKKAEVFTPSVIVDDMNDRLDKDYNGSVLDYIKRTVLEVTCGEAPFLTTRYDAGTGVEIPINKRVGVLDRKLRAIPNTATKSVYEYCVCESLKSVYGFEWQFDSLFLARRNLLMASIENYVDRYGVEPGYEKVAEWANIISYNIIRMDGITMCIPETDIPAKMMDWDVGEFQRFDGKDA